MSFWYSPPIYTLTLLLLRGEFGLSLKLDFLSLRQNCSQMFLLFGGLRVLDAAWYGRVECDV